MTALMLLAIAACTGDRADVKYMADGQAIAVNRTPVWTSIDELAGLPAPALHGDEARGVEPEDPDQDLAPPFRSPEYQVWSVSGTVFLARLEENGDIHLALRGDARRLIVEIVDPRCASTSYALDEIRGVRRAVRRLLRWRPLTDAALYQSLVGKRVRVEGPAFFDRNHGQRGAAPNRIEIHPVLSLEVLR